MKAREFETVWQHPRAVAAIDGKHIEIVVFILSEKVTFLACNPCFALQAPPNSGAAFYNYKSYYSFVLLAIVDARYKVGTL